MTNTQEIVEMSISAGQATFYTLFSHMIHLCQSKQILKCSVKHCLDLFSEVLLAGCMWC